MDFTIGPDHELSGVSKKIEMEQIWTEVVPASVRAFHVRLIREQVEIVRIHRWGLNTFPISNLPRDHCTPSLGQYSVPNGLPVAVHVRLL